jgi:Protein of unknown function (DUF4238)
VVVKKSQSTIFLCPVCRKVNELPPPIIHDNHYVPEAALRRWSINGTHLFAYRILVSAQSVPEWEWRAIRGVAYHRDLYTVIAGGKELDDFERWLNVEFEQPGLEAIDKLLSGSRLTPADWRSMVRFVATQDLRTPLSFIEWMHRWKQQIPEMLDRSMRKSIKQLEEAAEQHIVLNQNVERNEFTGLFKVTIEPPVNSESEAMIRAEVVAGRRLWIAAMRRLLTGVVETLCSHRWSVAKPDGDAEWPLTDHPAIRLNYYKPGHYDFGGGWGNPGSEMMMPVSPKHLLYVKVGEKVANRFTFSPEHTHLVQRLLVERAHRWVFATRPSEWVAKVRPRTVDPKIFKEEEQAWKDWHRDQSQSEVSSANRYEPEIDK